MGNIKKIRYYSIYIGEKIYSVTEDSKQNSFLISKNNEQFSQQEARDIIDNYFDLIMCFSVHKKLEDSSYFYECVYTLNKEKDKIMAKAYKNPEKI